MYSCTLSELVWQVVPEHRHLLDGVLGARPKPGRPLGAHLLPLEAETLGLHLVEKDITHEVGRRGACHLETRLEPGEERDGLIDG